LIKNDDHLRINKVIPYKIFKPFLDFINVKNHKDKKVYEIALCQFAYANSNLLRLLENRGTAIKNRDDE